MKTIKIWTLSLMSVLIALSFSGQVMAQEMLTLQDAIAVALQENHNIQIAKNTAEVSANNAHIGNAGLLPRIDLSSTATYNDNEIVSAAGNTNTAYTTSTAGLQASYTLFDGLGNIYNYKKLNSQKESGSLQARNNIEQTLVLVSQAYFNTAEASENVRLAGESLDISRERLQRAKNRSQFGQANTIEVLSAEVDFNADSVSYLNAQLYLDQAKRDLNVYLNREVNTEFSLDVRVDFQKQFELAELQKLAEKDNAAYQTYISGEKQSQYDVKIARSADLPQLTLQSSYGYNQQESELDINLGDPNRSFTAGATLSLNLFNGFRNSIQKQNAKIQLKNQQLQRDEALLNLKTDVANIYQSYRNSLFVLDVEEKSLESAQLNFTRTEELYGLGQVTTTQFREAQLNLIRAKNNILSAKYDAKLNEIRLLQLSGQLLSKNEMS